MILCRAPHNLLGYAVKFSKMMCDKYPKKNADSIIMGMRGEHAVADLFGPASIATCLAQQSGTAAMDYDLVHVQQNGRVHHIDVKTKWSRFDNDLSNRRLPGIDYVFVYPFSGSVGVRFEGDLVFAIAGWCRDTDLVPASPHTGSTYWHSPDVELRPIQELL